MYGLRPVGRIPVSPLVLPGAAATGFPAACGPEATGTGVLAADVVWPDVDTPGG